VVVFITPSKAILASFSNSGAKYGFKLFLDYHFSALTTRFVIQCITFRGILLYNV